MHGEGFTASAIRSVLTATTLLSSTPRRTFAQPAPAVEWLAKQLGVPALDFAPVVTWSERASEDPLGRILSGGPCVSQSSKTA